MRSWLLLAALLPHAALASEHGLSLGATAVILTNGANNKLSPRLGLEAAYTYGREAWRLGGGVRWVPGGGGSLPAEVYARVLLTPPSGTWRPAVGPEVGLSGLPINLPSRGGLPNELKDEEARRSRPFYVAVHAQPLRFVFRSFTVSALEVQWGTPIHQPGSALRLQLGLLHLGVVL
ncbi:hypothetical protein D187_002336 [Cystobacter fuscus DSM 2262]|uniref:Outer membrane protein beta-barrel domain-containing protein n=1 Tax=Cystobacter fuscus (strain ATCC 25194 / DSM 2262 / NBRC 100088 / M29) TaxID=1242864 RepID=S9P718_CYSF2|nr:hypothetical protein [Cystobacter fuscus]EPX60250.1 hypothetical protein D187_002336 [Cystobacter fuscus DSM 2262]